MLKFFNIERRLPVFTDTKFRSELFTFLRISNYVRKETSSYFHIRILLITRLNVLDVR